MAAITLPEWAKLETDPLKRGVIETLFKKRPLLQYIPFETIVGLAYAYTQEQALPGVAFRKLNSAYTPTVGVMQRLTETLMPFGGESDTDRAFVSAYGPGQRRKRLKQFLKAMSIRYVQTFVYGNSPASRAGVAFDDADGFDGLQARLDGGTQVVDAGGSSGTDGSSVLAFNFGEGEITGLQTEPVQTDDLGLVGTAYRFQIEHVAGMAIENAYSVGWVKDLAAATHTLTVADMNDLRDLLDETPTCYVMSKRSRTQLWNACIAVGTLLSTTFDILGNPVDSWGGRPILVDDAIINTETLS